MYMQILKLLFQLFFKCWSVLTLNLRYRKPPRCVGAISQI